MVGVVLAGLLGTMVGSWIAYGVGAAGASSSSNATAESCTSAPPRSSVRSAGSSATAQAAVLFGRMLPIVRAFVSLPAGVAKMPVGRFTVLSLIGASPGCWRSRSPGHALGGDWTSVRKGFEYVDYAIVALVVLGIVYAIVRRRRGRNEPATDAAG